MRTLSRLFILGVILVFVGCATVCPPQAVVEIMWTPFGPIVIETGEDTYCEERHSKERFMRGDGWLTLEEYEAMAKKWEQEAEEAEGSI